MKRRILIIIGILVILLLAVIIYLYSNPRVAVLGYHAFYKDEIDQAGPYTMDIKQFDKQMKYLKEHNYKTLSMEEFECWKSKKCDIPRKSVVLTFDDGYVSNYEYALDILKKYDFKATIFVIGGYISSSEDEKSDNSYMSVGQIKKIQKYYPNIEIESHTYNMHDYDLSYKTNEVVKKDIDSFKKKIGKSEYHAYPYGLHTEEMKNIYRENGYKLAFGYGPEFRKAKQSDDNYNIPRLSIDSGMSMLKFKLRLIIPY